MGVIQGFKGFNPFNYLGELGLGQPNQSGNQTRARRTGVSSMAAGGARNAGEARVTGTPGSISPDPNVGSFDGAPQPLTQQPPQPPMAAGADMGGLPINSSMGSPEVDFNRIKIPASLPGFTRSRRMGMGMAANDASLARPAMKPNMPSMGMAPLPPTARNPRLMELGDQLGRIGMTTRPAPEGRLGNTGGFVDEVFQSPNEAAAEAWKQKGFGTKALEGLQGFLSGGLMGGIQGARGVPWQQRQAASMTEDRNAQRQSILDQLNIEKAGIEQEEAQRRGDIDSRQADIQGRTLENTMENQQRIVEENALQRAAEAERFNREQETARARIYVDAARDPQMKWNPSGIGKERFGGLLEDFSPAPPQTPSLKDRFGNPDVDNAGNVWMLDYGAEGGVPSNVQAGGPRRDVRSRGGGSSGSGGGGGGDKVGDRQDKNRKIKAQEDLAASVAYGAALKEAEEMNSGLRYPTEADSGRKWDNMGAKQREAAVNSLLQTRKYVKMRQDAMNGKAETGPSSFEQFIGGFLPQIYGVHGQGK